MASFLVAFVPQMCGEKMCGIMENMYFTKGQQYSIASGFNILTFVSMMGFYYVELKRENLLINYLDVNRELPTDARSVSVVLQKLGPDQHAELRAVTESYKFFGYVMLLFFFMNILMSAIPIFENPLDSKTYTVFATNLLFVVTKLYVVYDVLNTKENVFLSAYLIDRQQFNDVDSGIILPRKPSTELFDSLPVITDDEDEHEISGIEISENANNELTGGVFFDVDVDDNDSFHEGGLSRPRTVSGSEEQLISSGDTVSYGS